MKPPLNFELIVTNSLRSGLAYASVDRVITGWGNGLSPKRLQAITRIHITSYCQIWTLRTNFSQIWIQMQQFPLTKINLNITSAKWWSFLLGLNVLLKLALIEWLWLLPVIHLTVPYIYSSETSSSLTIRCSGTVSRLTLTVKKREYLTCLVHWQVSHFIYIREILILVPVDYLISSGATSSHDNKKTSKPNNNGP